MFVLTQVWVGENRTSPAEAVRLPGLSVNCAGTDQTAPEETSVY